MHSMTLNDWLSPLEMADTNINDTGDNRLKRHFPAESIQKEQDDLTNWLISQVQDGAIVTDINGRWSATTPTGTALGVHQSNRRSHGRPSVGGAPDPSPGTNFIARNREEWAAIWDRYKKEGQALHGVLTSFDASDPYSQETLHSILSSITHSALEDADAKRRRLGNNVRSL
ncbi:hypothetical protein FPRO04_04854 [Fusarium proliferatum]|nr:hypothetical protein FPRO04_04854 [Fusarium proliferatum]